MITSRKKPPPVLEINYTTEYDALIKKTYQSIRKWPICWIAHEELEVQHDGTIINNSILFELHQNSLVFKELKMGRVLAHIRFNPQLNLLPSRKSVHNGIEL